jgi:two-component system sensor histidine kinase HydH
MERDSSRFGPLAAVPDPDLQTVLRAWHDATTQSDETLTSLQAEVRRLTEELQEKNRGLSEYERAGCLGSVVAQLGDKLHGKLAPMALHVSLLRRRVLDDPTALDLLQKIDSGCAAMDAAINDVFHLTSERDPSLGNVNVRALVEEVHASVLPQLSAQGIATVLDVGEHVTVLADRAMLRRALVHLTLNALEAMPHGGELVVTSYSGPRGVELEIADSGAGLSAEARRRGFEPFFTTKGASAGLGLAVVQRVLALHGGDVVASNCPEGGAAFTLRFPQRAMRAAA